MTSLLDDPRLEAVLERLHAKSEAQEAEIAGVSTRNPDAYDLYLQALSERATFSYGGLQASEDLLKGALVTDPNFLDAKTELAVNYLHQFETGLMDGDEAVANCTAMTAQVLESRPDDPAATAIQLFVGLAGDDERGDPDRVFGAVEELEKLVAENPADYRIRVILARLLQKVKQFDRALVVHLEALQRDPFNPRIHYELGSLYLELGRPRDARAALEKSLEIEARQPNAYGKLALVSAQLGDGVGAVQQLLKAFEVDPRDHELPGHIAMFLYDLGLVEEGDDFRDLVLAIAPTSEISYQVELRRAVMMGDVDAGIASARHAIENDVGERKSVFSDAAGYLMRTAVSSGTVDETTAYLEQNAPGIFDINAETVSPKYRNAQIAALDAWYVALPRDELLRRLDDLLESAAEFGIDPLEEPGVKLGVHALRGETEAAIETALTQVFTQPVTTALHWREMFSQAQYAEIIADERVKDALQRWENDLQQREQAIVVKIEIWIGPNN